MTLKEKENFLINREVVDLKQYVLRLYKKFIKLPNLIIYRNFAASQLENRALSERNENNLSLVKYFDAISHDNKKYFFLIKLKKNFIFENISFHF